MATKQNMVCVFFALTIKLKRRYTDRTRPKSNCKLVGHVSNKFYGYINLKYLLKLKIKYCLKFTYYTN